MCVPCRFLPTPDKNFFNRSTASLVPDEPPSFFTLLFLRLVNVSSMNRVRELRAISLDMLIKQTCERVPHGVLLRRHFCVYDLHDVFQRRGVIGPQLLSRI